jgi:hypothetical protein
MKELLKKALVGQKITAIRYLSDEEKNAMGWYHKAPVIELEDGILLFPSADAEGNDAGVLFTNLEFFPVIGRKR